ncbi:MAG TPA: LysR family transcriptional regulator [Steroidobacteraceae bacterium]|jgi:DNA-binding transcriptional LysR family regulator
MQLTLRQLEIFHAIAASGSTAEAAKQLPLSQSATSAALLELEFALKVRLFDRVGKRLLLNDHGRTLLPAALSLIDGARAVERAFGQSAGPPVDIQLFASTTVGNYLLPGLIAGFTRSHPTARVDLRVGNTQDAVNAVLEFETDVGFIEGPCHATDITVRPWLEDELVLVASPDHPLARAAKRARLSADQLREARWLMREPGSGTRETVDHLLLPHMAQLASVITLGSPEAIRNAAVEGLGISCISRYVVQEALTDRRLALLPTKLPRLTRRLMLIHHTKKLLSGSLERFIAHCIEYAELHRRQDFEI